ncbi:MAG: rhodanese-like domain-containing protein [Chthoniobacteraceae bacterium]
MIDFCSMMRRWKIILCGAAVLGLAVGNYGWSMTDGEEGMAKMFATVRREFPRVPQLSTAELAAWMANKDRSQPQVLDVREAAEFDVSHLHGALRVEPDASAANVLARVDPARPIVVYCSVGYRSSKLAQRLIDAGGKSVSNLEGSIFAWANEGRPLEKDGHPVRTVHPYNDVFGRLLKPEYRAK